MRFRFTLFTESITIPAPNQPVFPGLSSFVNVGSGTNWTTGPTPSVTLPLSSTAFLRSLVTGGIEDVSYQINYDLDVTSLLGGIHNVIVAIRLYNVSFTSYVEQTTGFSGLVALPSW